MAELKWNLTNRMNEWTVAGLKPSKGTTLSEETARNLRQGEMLPRMWNVMVDASNASEAPKVELKLDGGRGLVTLTFTQDNVTCDGPAKVELNLARKPRVVELD